ncbi:MAG: hypothetical protein KDA61_12370, partial [Planctomycetales bacterium]|nr:hypothetical protein [Planctomycetales bacterium]
DNTDWPIASGGDYFSLASAPNDTGNFAVFHMVHGTSFTLTAHAENFHAPLNGIQIVERTLQVDVQNDIDDGDYSPGRLSLREAIALANARTGADAITFGASGAIHLSSQLPTISDALTIFGPGADQLAIRGNQTARIFTIDDGDAGSRIPVEISGIAITEGSVAGAGGGILNREDLTLQAVTVTGNTSTSGGGGIMNHGGLNLINSTVSSNTSNVGGGIRNLATGDAIANVINSTISGNTATSRAGGGIQNYFGQVLLKNSTVTDNYGGGIWGFGNLGYAETRVAASIVAGNDHGDVQRHGNSPISILSDGFNLVGNGTAISSFNQTGDQTGVDPMLGSLSLNGGTTPTHALLAGSPAVDGIPLVHAYEFTDGLGDTLLGPALVDTGTTGQLNSGEFVFATSDGLLLESPRMNPTDYTLEIVFSFDNLPSGFQKILDFKNLSADAGLYTQGDDLYFYGAGVRKNNLLVAGQEYRLVVSRDASTDMVRVAVDGVEAFSFTDASGMAAFTSQGNPVRFFQDDTADSSSEEGSGRVASIRVFNGAFDLPQSAANLLSSSSWDQRGAPFTRFDGAGIDIGACERHSLAASYFQVNTTSDASDGDFSAGNLSLREAIELANFTDDAETITFDPVVFATPQTIALTSPLPTITESVSILGPGAALLVLDAGKGPDNTPGTFDGFRIVDINDGNDNDQINVAFSGLTLTGADTRAYGGAIMNFEDLEITASVISGNSATIGGGVVNYGAATITGSTLSDNKARDYGGGIYSRGAATIASSTISGNSAGYGGGIVNTGAITITDSTISGNHAEHSGGGVYNLATATIAHTTISGNGAALSGGGMHNAGDATITNTIIANSLSGARDLTSGGGTFAGSFNLIADGSHLADFANSTEGNPLLGPLADYGGPTLTHALQAGSPAINEGDPTIVGGIDQRGAGFDRVQFGRTDIGAFEYDANDFPQGNLEVSVLADQFDGDYSAGNLSFREALVIANANAGAETITFDPEMFATPQTLALAYALPSVTTSVSILGPGQDLLAIDASQGLGGLQFRIFDFNDNNDSVASEVTISGLSLTGAHSLQGGGAIQSRETLALSDCTLHDNHGVVGGGAFLNGDTTITNCAITENSAVSSGGAIHLNGPHTLTVHNSVLSG